MAYFSNGSEGEVLDEQCADCPIGRHPDAPCPVLLVQSLYNYDQCEEGQEKLREVLNLLINEKGICHMREVLLKFVTKEPIRAIDPRKILPGMEEFARKAGIGGGS
jgi:hypothetical protein